MRSAKISVIMPIYNGAATLPATLQSVVDQGDVPIEVIAVNQGSTDGSRDILAEFATRLPLTIIDAPDSTNWMANTNIGLNAASAPLATMLHQDDLWMPGRITALLALADTYPDAALWLHPAWFVGDDNALTGTFGPAFGSTERLIPGPEALQSLVVQNTIALPAAMFRTRTARDLGGLSEDLWYTADWDFWLKLAATGPVAWTPKKLAGFRIHANSQTVQGSKQIKDFRTQLTIPVERHIGAIDAAAQPRIKARAEASNCLNLFLAARFHKQPASIWPFLGKFLRLGPMGWASFIKDTRIIARVMPRLRILNNKGSAT